jgi:hypothetical protein
MQYFKTKNLIINRKLCIGGPSTPQRDLKEPSQCTGDFFNAPNFSPFSPSKAHVSLNYGCLILLMFSTNLQKTSLLSLLSMTFASPSSSTASGTFSDSDYEGNVFSCQTSPAMTMKEEKNVKHYLIPGERLRCGEYLASPLGNPIL